MWKQWLSFSYISSTILLGVFLTVYELYLFYLQFLSSFAMEIKFNLNFHVHLYIFLQMKTSVFTYKTEQKHTIRFICFIKKYELLCRTSLSTIGKICLWLIAHSLDQSLRGGQEHVGESAEKPRTTKGETLNITQLFRGGFTFRHAHPPHRYKSRTETDQWAELQHYNGESTKNDRWWAEHIIYTKVFSSFLQH